MATKPVENHKEEVPFAHYCQLFSQLDPEEAAVRTAVAFDAGTQEFCLEFLTETYWVHWPDYRIRSENAQALALKSLPAQTFLLRYLLEGKAEPFHGSFLTFREMPWGELYISPFTGRCLTRAAFTFGTRIAQFRKAMESLGATPLSHGDAAYEIPVLGDYRMQLIVWEGDEEFPPSAQILYSDNFVGGFAAEDRVVAGDLAITAVKQRM